MIRDVLARDSRVISEIYNFYVASSIVTFEEEPIAPQDMAHRIEVVSQTLPWIVYEQDKSVVGYAYASRWRERSAYRYSVEATVYLSCDVVGNGLGSVLYSALISRLHELSVRAVIGGIALPNAACVALHEKLGFVKVAHFKDVGWKRNRWVDVGYWQLLLPTKT